MPDATVIVIALVVVAVLAGGLVAIRRRSNDGVESFRRQIDALGPEARRGVVDQVNQAVETDDEPAEGDEPAGGGRRRVIRRDRDAPPPADEPADETADEPGDRNDGA